MKRSVPSWIQLTQLIQNCISSRLFSFIVTKPQSFYPFSTKNNLTWPYLFIPEFKKFINNSKYSSLPPKTHQQIILPFLPINNCYASTPLLIRPFFKSIANLCWICKKNNIIFQMDQRQCELASGHERKNQKNIYVQKINSLMRISRQNLQEDQLEINNALNKKKIKKARSELGKNAFKLQKNRESAKRARLRKKLYIKLLESQVNRLKELASEGERIEKQSQKFLAMIDRKEEVNQQNFDEIERYLSRDNLNDSKNAGQQREDLPARMDKLVEEICQISACSSLRNIRELSSQISLEDIMKAQTTEDKQTAGQQLQEIIKEVMFESEELRQIYMEMMMENEKVKKIIDEGNLKKQEFPLQSDSNEQNLEQPRNPLLVQQFCSYLRRPNEPNNIFINLVEAERILIQATSFLDVKAKFEEI